MKWIVPFFCCALAACFQPKIENGSVSCAKDKSCPSGFTCINDRCYLNGTGPDGGRPTDMAGTDGGNARDAGQGGGGADGGTGGGGQGGDMGGNRSPNGTQCSSSAQCTSGFCVDGRCCNSACSGQCETCNSGAGPGTCMPAPQGPVPLGHAPCGGAGTTCGGQCDGVHGANCSYPTAMTSCGSDCSGKCDGAGQCQGSGSGTPCPDGYACGADQKCLSSCSNDTQCQTNFHCMASKCVRVAESDCLDGIDNNGDGKADCQDPTCQAQYTCVPTGGNGTVGVVGSSCPTGFGPATTMYADLQDTSCTNGCTCKTQIDECALDVSIFTDNTCSAGEVSATISGPPNGMTSCAPVQTPSVANYQGFHSGSIKTTKHCVAGGSSTRPEPAFGTKTNLCPARRISQTCGDSNQVCTAKPSTASLCIALSGNANCPTGYPSRTVYYQSYQKGSCSCSQCASAPSLNCGMNGAACATGSCDSGVCSFVAGAENAKCDVARNAASNVAALTAWFTSSGSDNCDATPRSTPSVGTGPTTVCCM